MPRDWTRIPGDYNRGRVAPFERPARAWSPLVCFIAAAAITAALVPLDAPISRAARSIALGGDVRRELEAVQQFGQLVSVGIVLVGAWLLDPTRRTRLIGVALGCAATSAACHILKLLTGRPRPKFDDPSTILGPFGLYPIDAGGEVILRHSWEFWKPGGYDLASMPSSHTAGAVALAVGIGALYPRLRPLLIALAVSVAVARVITGAHYPTDVTVGAAIGLIVSSAVVRWWLGRTSAGSPSIRPDSERCPSG